MTKRELIDLLQPFDDDIRIVAKGIDEPNSELRNLLSACYRCKRGVLRLRDETLLEDGEGYIEVLMITTVWALYAKKDRHIVDLFPTEALANAYSGPLNMRHYVAEPIERDVVFIVREYDYDAERIVAVTETYAKAQEIHAKELGNVSIEIYEVQR